jgi:nucleoid DNA-binding protein
VAGISKSETMNRLSEKTGLTKKQVGTVLEELAALAYKEARNGFTFPGVGKLVIVDRKARLGRNPATGSREARQVARTALFFAGSFIDGVAAEAE